MDECKHENIKYLASTQVDPGMACGGGESTTLFECLDCRNLYFQNVYFDCDYPTKINKSANQYTGKLDVETLKQEIPKMYRRIDYTRLAVLEDRLTR